MSSSLSCTNVHTSQTPSSVTTTKQQGPTTCYMDCEWSEWCNDEDPSVKFLFQDENEDMNSCSDIVCDNPVDIECQSVDGIPVNEQTFPYVTCELHTGLHCDVSTMQVCSNFQIRYNCCSEICTTWPQTPESKVSSSLGVIGSSESSTAPSKKLSTLTPSTTTKQFKTPNTRTSVSVASEQITTEIRDSLSSSSGEITTTATLQTLPISKTQYPGTPSQPLTARTQETMIPSSRLTVESTRSTVSTLGVSTPIVSEDTMSSSMRSTELHNPQTPSLVITTEEQACVPKCEWSDWCDGEKANPPKPLFKDETEDKNDCDEYICENPVDIECVTMPDELPHHLFPGVECNLETGLHCDVSKVGVCPDFKIRYKCCNDTCRPTTTGPVSKTITPTETPSRPPTTRTTEITKAPTTPSETTTMTPSETTVTTAETTVTTAETTVTTAETTTELPCLKCKPEPVPSQHYTFDGCQTKVPLELNKCAGSCPSSYGYVMNEYGNWEEDVICSCCRVSSFKKISVELECPGGGTKTKQVHKITGCSCKDTTCST